MKKIDITNTKIIADYNGGTITYSAGSTTISHEKGNSYRAVRAF